MPARPTPMQRIVVPLLALLTCTLSACSLLFTKGPPPGHEQLSYFTCSESDAAPVVDLVLGGLDLIAGFAIAGDPESYGYTEEEGGQAIAAGVIEAAVLGVSAGVGFNRVKKCRAAKAAWAERQAHPTPSAAAPGVPIDSLSVNPPASTISVGESVQLQANAYASGGARVSAPTLKWSSSNNAVAWVVSQNGLVTALAPGTVVIAASATNLVGTATVVVRAP